MTLAWITLTQTNQYELLSSILISLRKKEERGGGTFLLTGHVSNRNIDNPELSSHLQLVKRFFQSLCQLTLEQFNLVVTQATSEAHL